MHSGERRIALIETLILTAYICILQATAGARHCINFIRTRAVVRSLAGLKLLMAVSLARCRVVVVDVSRKHYAAERAFVVTEQQSENFITARIHEFLSCAAREGEPGITVQARVRLCRKRGEASAAVALLVLQPADRGSIEGIFVECTGLTHLRNTQNSRR